MTEKTIEFDSLPLRFEVKEDQWILQLSKSQTRVKNIKQLGLITQPSDFFVPLMVDEEDDLLIFSFTVDPNQNKWEDLKALGRNEKLRLLCNVASLKHLINTRMTFFLHPNNLLFNDNLMPMIIYRGIRDVVPPYEMDEKQFLKQFKCLAIALFSKKYTFDQLYSGSLQHATGTEFERQVNAIHDLGEFIHFLQKSYREEQTMTEKNMQLVSKQRYQLFRRLSVIMMIVSILLAAPLAYIGFVKIPYNEKLMTAHEKFLATDYGEVISILEKENPEKLPQSVKYILAYSYVKVEKLSAEEKKVILKNVSLKSEESYLLYWIHNGQGDFEQSLDLAKYLDDPQLIMYGLVKKIEQDKNDPDLSGSERDEAVSKSQEELDQYREKYNLLPEEDDEEKDKSSKSKDKKKNKKTKKKDKKSTDKKEKDTKDTKKTDTDKEKKD
ncbi:MAG TPA: type VII secretion protein EssB [Bacillota bacterium]|nr:type VII secretion protein EssB [Bacillota bacterium]